MVISAPGPSPPNPARAPRTALHEAPLIEIEAKVVVVLVRDGADPSLVETMLPVLRARVILPTCPVRVLIATKPVDFRESMDGLAAVVKEELRAYPSPG